MALSVLGVLLPVVVVPTIDDGAVLPKLATLWIVLVVAGVSVARWDAASSGPLVVVQRSIDVPVMAFVGLAALATALSTDVSRSFVGLAYQYQGFSTLLAYMVVFVMARHTVTSVRTLRAQVVGILAGCLLVSLFGLAQAVGIDPIYGRTEYWPRSFATMGQPNALGALLVVALPLVFVVRWSRPARLVAALVIVSCVVLTFSRGAYLALVAFVPIALIAGPVRSAFARSRRRGIAFVLGGLAVAAVILAAVLAASGVGDRDLDPRRDGSVQLRFDVWRVAGAVTLANPVFGVGPETFPEQSRDHIDDALSSERARRLEEYYLESPHNIFLATSSGAGLPATVALVLAGSALVVRAARHCRTRPDDAFAVTVLLASLTAYLITQCLMTSEISSSFVAALVAGALVGIMGPQRVQAPMA